MQALRSVPDGSDSHEVVNTTNNDNGMSNIDTFSAQDEDTGPTTEKTDLSNHDTELLGSTTPTGMEAGPKIDEHTLDQPLSQKAMDTVQQVQYIT
jgi:hypothetical protein